MALIAIDPGKRKAGIAVAVEGRLLASGTITRRHPSQLPGALWDWANAVLRNHHENHPRAFPAGHLIRVVVETPVDYPGKERREADLQSLRDMNACFWDMRQQSVPLATFSRRVVTPHAWKGNVPKEVHHRRVFMALEDGEPWPEGHDARDAVGLALFAMGRVGRGGVRV